MSIFIVRHGETAGNASGIIQMPDTPLNERGQAQARACGQRLEALGVERIIASDYGRAHMTARAIERATSAPLEIHEGLRERHFGEYRGQHHSIVPDMFGPDIHPPGGESWDEFHTRVSKCWADVARAAQETPGNIAVVTHGLVLYSLALNCLQLPEGAVAERGFGNTSVTIADHEPPWLVRELNSCSHLDEDIAARQRGGV
ncbi:MAG: histidine phosphatase family protein [Gammaproteobacteria bacterium]|nr:histidine phosphatase family protein [Gammaproteobacteria bacterium]